MPASPPRSTPAPRPARLRWTSAGSSAAELGAGGRGEESLADDRPLDRVGELPEVVTVAAVRVCDDEGGLLRSRRRCAPVQGRVARVGTVLARARVLRRQRLAVAERRA